MNILLRKLMYVLLVFPITNTKAQTEIISDTLPLSKHVDVTNQLQPIDTANANTIFNKLKFVALNKSKSNYISFGGETRLRFEYFRNENLGASNYRDNGYLQQRSFFSAEAHLFKHFSIVTQLNSSTTSFRKGGPPSIFDKDVIDIHQAFVDVYFKKGKSDFTIRTGRQELKYGNGKLVERREGPNQRLAFDALRVIVKTKAADIETFIAQPVLNKQNAFDNVANKNVTFWGAYSSFKHMKKIKLDVYYFGLENKVAAFEKGRGEELRHTLGFKLNGSLKEWEYETENFFQTGTFSNDNLLAWGATVNISYNIPIKLKTKIEIGGAINSGDGGTTSNKLGTFNGLFPTGFYIGPGAVPIGPSNLKAARIALNSEIKKNVMLMPGCIFLWRQNINDGVYTPGTTLYRAGNSASNKDIGTQLNLTVLFKVNQHITFMPSYAKLLSGDFFKETGASKNVSYFNADLTLKF